MNCTLKPRSGPALPQTRPAFTLIELLVVIGVIGILAAMLLQAVAMARDKGRQTDCSNNLRQIGICMQLYIDNSSGYFPSIYSGTYDAPVHDPNTPTDYFVYLQPYSLRRPVTVCKCDPSANPDPNNPIGSYVFNGMYAFAKKQDFILRQPMKIIFSERADPPAGFADTPYPAYLVVSNWESQVCKMRHRNLSNYLFVDDHVAPQIFEQTIGEEFSSDGHRNSSNQHYVTEFK